jgi:hypothetical protein
VVRRVKISGIVAIALVLVVVGVFALGGHNPGQSGPGQHLGGGAANTDAKTVQGCEPQLINHDGGSGATLTCKDAQGTGQTAQNFTCRNPSFVGLQVDRDLQAGKFTVTVKDGAGATVFSKTYSGKGGDSANLNGQDGSWKITAEREDGFTGGFTVQIYCGTH